MTYSLGGRKPTNTGYGLGKQGYKMGMYKDDSETEDDFNNPLLNKPSFSQRPSDRDVSSCMYSSEALLIALSVHHIFLSSI